MALITQRTWIFGRFAKVELEMCNIGYLSKTHLKPKSCEISFAHNLFINYLIVLKPCTKHDSDTALFCARFRNNWTTETNVMDEQDFTRFEFKMDGYPISQDPKRSFNQYQNRPGDG